MLSKEKSTMSVNKKLYSKNFFIANLVILGVIAGFALAFVGRGTLFGASSGSLPVVKAETPAVQVSPEIGAALSQAEAVQNAFRYVAKSVLPSVVEIDVIDKVSKDQQPQTQPQIPFEFFFGPQNTPDQNNTPQFNQEGLGSGVIVRKDGNTVYVLTNNHVAGNAEKIKVIMNDGKEFKGTLVGADDRKDIALVKFEASDPNITVAKLGDSSKIQVGDWAIALGSPFGLVSSVTAGIVSAVGRNGGPDGNINDFIQTDAAINKGNSGGALVNIRGEVVGINTWIASPTGGSVGLGFAIPINNLKSAIDDFIHHGQVRYGWLGVSLINVTGDQANAKELNLDGKKGAFVGDVFLGGPADKSGILPGDFVISLNGSAIASEDDFVRKVGDIPAGSTAEINLVRNGTEMAVSAKIELRDKNVASNNKDLFPGVTVISLSSDSIDKSKLPNGVKGVLVADVASRSPASVMGVKTGDILQKVNDKEVNTLNAFYSAINDKSVKKLTFTVLRDGQTLDTLAYVKK
jgi:Do/DeqQ family serine protease